MSEKIVILRAMVAEAQEIAVMVGELLNEIMNAVGESVFNFNVDETTDRLRDFLSREKYFVFVARDLSGTAVAFIALYESFALYAEGVFGTIPELYVHPAHRNQQLGSRLVSQAKSFGIARGWKRLEVTTPPLPVFDRALEFYEGEGFSITGGRKLKVSL